MEGAETPNPIVDTVSGTQPVTAMLLRVDLCLG